jgi:hypothetical protein
MRDRFNPKALISVVVVGITLAPTQMGAQWVKYPAAVAPRKADGSVDITAATPHLADGKPDFSGVWASADRDPRRPGGVPDPGDASASRYMVNLGVDLPGGLPYQPWLATLVKQRTATQMKDDPHVWCFPDNFLRSYGQPHLLKYVHSAGLLLMLNEMNANYRQVFTDGRPLPKDPAPSYMGYSSGKWSGDTLVADTIGVRDDTWIDWNGSVIGESAKVREEIRRPDFGHMEIKITVDDPKAYTKPWSVTLKQRYVVDVELIDEICLENERSLRHMK